MRNVRPGAVTASIAIAIAIALATRSSSAEPEERRTARLHFEAPDACPDEAALSRDVSARLGYEPFRADGATGVRVVVSRAQQRFHGRIDLFDAADRPTGRRDLPDETDCAEIVRAASFAVALAIDPVRAQVTRPPAVAKPAPAPAPAAPASRVHEVVAPPRAEEPLSIPPSASPPLSVYVGAGVRSSALRVPSAGLGGGVFVGVGQRGWSITLEGQADAPLGETREGALAVEASLASAIVAGCLHAEPMRFCLLGELGAMQGSGLGADVTKRDTTLLGAAGARVAAHVFLTKSLFLRPHVDALAPITRTTLRIGDRSLWTTPSVGVALGMGFGVTL